MNPLHKVEILDLIELYQRYLEQHVPINAAPFKQRAVHYVMSGVTSGSSDM